MNQVRFYLKIIATFIKNIYYQKSVTIISLKTCESRTRSYRRREKEKKKIIIRIELSDSRIKSPLKRSSTINKKLIVASIIIC